MRETEREGDRERERVREAEREREREREREMERERGRWRENEEGRQRGMEVVELKKQKGFYRRSRRRHMWRDRKGKEAMDNAGLNKLQLPYKMKKGKNLNEVKKKICIQCFRQEKNMWYCKRTYRLNQSYS